MNKLSKLIMYSSLLAGSQFVSTAAMAQTAPNGVLTGAVIATKGITVNCVLTLTLDSSLNTGDIDMDPGDANCAALVFNNEPYTTTYTPNTSTDPVTGLPIGTLTFLGVDVTTITLGDCAGSISGQWNGSTLNVSATLPPKTGGPACTVNGSAS
ncbi:hypothetical protein [Sphingomonas sp.]|uniref:hypothetical protein n=1 Tax=Sphingomonas sp. TaxID=28214 RepID=UPI003D6CB017